MHGEAKMRSDLDDFVEQYSIGEEPYYRAVRNEISLYESAYELRLRGYEVTVGPGGAVSSAEAAATTSFGSRS